MRELEAGFSVSETSEDIGGEDEIQSSAPSSRQNAFNSVKHSPDILGLNSHYHPTNKRGINHSSVHEDMVRFEQHRAVLQQDVAAAKQRYLKRVNALERELDKARSEKRELQHMIES